ERIEQGRNFCNKLWNVSRFRQMADEHTQESTQEEIINRINPAQLSQDDHAILLRLIQTLDEVDKLYQQYEFNSVLHSIYRFFWNDLCDWYVENSKPRMRGGEDKHTCLAVQDLCLRQVLLLLHPVTPFITEELWQVLGFSGGQSIQWTSPDKGSTISSTLTNAGITLDPSALDEMLSIRELVTSMRALKADRNLANNKQVEFSFLAEDAKAEMVYEYSIRKNASVPVNITWMKQTRDETSSWGGWETPNWSTPFSGFRWIIPEVCGFQGRAIYTDCDMINLRDISELWNLEIPQDKWMLARDGKRFGGKEYCVILFDCAKFQMDTKENWKNVQTAHQQFMQIFLQNKLVGPLDKRWNCHDGDDLPLEEI
ncbi:MAG: hypothetical protein EBY48_11245, partial [Opitutae bacterium]|nr:hypothetical protein [Opitutae bacterium]